jgi:DNA-directed RNA polymerase specialized sigma24 family protein
MTPRRSDQGRGAEPSRPDGGAPLGARGAGARPPGYAEALLARMRGGDREAAAEFVVTFGSQIRRRFRSRLGRVARAVYDSEDLFLSIARRLDELVLGGRLEANSVDGLWALMGSMALHIGAHQRDIARREARAVAVVADRTGVEAPGTVEIVIRRERTRLLLRRAAERLKSEDRRIMVLRVARRSFAEIARRVGLAIPAAQKRWERIKAALRR